jgi:predicted transposase YbfD/YdcC
MKNDLDLLSINLLLEDLNDVYDPRRDLKKLYPIKEILLLILLAQLNGFETYREYKLYGSEKLGFLKLFLPYTNGIPSISTICRILALTDSKEVETIIESLVRKFIKKGIKNDLIAIDGKTHRGASHDSKLHLVSAVSTSTGLCLAQEIVDDKSNEIASIPKILDRINVKEQIITIDAMGCQVDIADKIIAKKANYILALKANQKQCFNSVKSKFDEIKDTEIFEETNKDHGRIETRKIFVSNKVKRIENGNKWNNLQTIIKIESTRYNTKHKTESKETRYFISSLKATAKEFLSYIRSHWYIENKVHWVLDVVFKEDKRIIWNRNSAINEAIIRRIALMLLKQLQAGYQKKYNKKISLKSLRKILIIQDKVAEGLFFSGFE